ncbi:dihydrodipicolinate synthase family protein [Siculibacillus lacustris]|uniref:Dihydrodipicolinate synthase family protein n=1 Tax=Siculibacillus lacustris TaxID=1549641 RepID=A0A4V2KUC0_9HYPH|nr:dihydrodipicolinate synthase family protein [Siculibacillus lacustris]TBW40856.1 dihydrodipicolinate synthase family protein [Siculibacillus lacustris]
MSQRIQGVLSAVVTPFDGAGDFAPAALRRQIERQVAQGNGLFCAGTNGEFFVLETAEKIAVAETTVDAVAGRVPVVAHIGEVSTAATISLGRAVAAAGVDAVSVVTPWFVPLKQSELIDHYTRIADAVPVPVFLYNIPARTGATIAPETAATLGAHPNIVGVKDSAGSWESLAAYLEAAKDVDGFDVLCGPDHLAHRGFLAGCSACISGLSNLAPQWVGRIWSRFAAGDVAGSAEAQDVVSGIRQDLYAVGFAPAAVKKAVALLGEDVGDSRYATAFSAEDLAAIRAVIAKYRLDTDR